MFAGKFGIFLFASAMLVLVRHTDAAVVAPEKVQVLEISGGPKLVKPTDRK